MLVEGPNVEARKILLNDCAHSLLGGEAARSDLAEAVKDFTADATMISKLTPISIDVK
jgi:hypothetical protein